MSQHYDDHPDHIINQALAILESRQRHLGNAFTQPKAAADFLRLKMGCLLYTSDAADEHIVV